MFIFTIRQAITVIVQSQRSVVLFDQSGQPVVQRPAKQNEDDEEGKGGRSDDVEVDTGTAG